MAELALLKRFGLPPRVSNEKVMSSVLPLLKSLSEADPDEFAVVNAEFNDYKARTVRDFGIVSNFYSAYNKRPSTKTLTDGEIAAVLDDNFDYLPKKLKPGELVEMVTAHFQKWQYIEGFEYELKERFLCDRDRSITTMSSNLKDALEELFFLPLDQLKEYRNKFMARVVLTTLKECMGVHVESAGAEDDEEKRWNEVEKRIAASAEIVKGKQEKIVVLEKKNDSLMDENATLKRELQLLLTLTEQGAEKKAKHD